MSLLSTPPDESVVARRSAPRTALSALPDATQRGVFITASAALYASIILLAVLTLNPYFSQTWDVVTFIQAAQRFLNGGAPFDLYAASRAAQTWPFAYPPLHALVVALALGIGSLLHALPDFVWARVPVIIADIAAGVVLYRVVERTSASASLARLALLLWLFNPITLYDTAVQGHFESEWLLFVLLAYVWFRDSKGDWTGDVPMRAQAATAAALAVAVLFKQVAVLFTIPIWIILLRNLVDRRSLKASGQLLVSLATFGGIVGIVCLPFLLYSNDFLYMNLTYVENVPVQTQSWLVAVLGLTRAAPDALVSDFILLRYQTYISLAAAAGIALWGARQGKSLYWVGALISIAFFLTSKKVMGYYYVMLFPFLLAEFLPRRRFDVVLFALVLTTWMTVSPYYAGWVDHSHWRAYALLGVLNSLAFVLLGYWMLTDKEPVEVAARTAFTVGVGLFGGGMIAALVQPLVQSAGSPIRAPIVAPEAGTAATMALLVLAGALVILLVVIGRLGKEWGALQRWAYLPVLIFAPLFFAVYTLTKEVTAVFEIALHALGG